ncbi:MAG: hypothetical protein KAV82_09010 [Phycisphaerae bacterium]|nr:hypothetical protein [Phycisphaerae bacterium]
MSRIKWILIVVVGGIVGVSAMAQTSQQFPNARPVWESAGAGAIATRAPGRMVRQGNTRFHAAHSAAINRTRQGPTITETEPAITPGHQLKVDMIQTIFQDLNLAIQILAQAMLMPDGDTSPDSGNGTTPPGSNQPPADVSDLLGTVHGPAT